MAIMLTQDKLEELQGHLNAVDDYLVNIATSCAFHEDVVGEMFCKKARDHLEKMRKLIYE